MIDRTKRLGVVLAALVAACSSDTTGGGDAGPVAPPEWRPVLENLDGTLLSVWGTSDKDVWAVGGPRGNAGFESLVVRFDGTQWTRLRPGGVETFWWVFGTGPSDVWLTGEKGRIAHWDGAAFKDFASGTTATLYGAWAASPTDAWAVGGTPEDKNGPQDVLLHWDGAAWKPEALPEALGRVLFKVWGASADDVYVVGEAGTIWHRTAGTWKREGQGVAKDRLLTVQGCSASEVYAVGSRQVLESDGKGTWSVVDTPMLLSDVNGVSCGGDPKRVVVVGGGSLKLRFEDGKWIDDFGKKPFLDLHGAWVDPTGAMWGVGGNFVATPQPNVSRQGVVARYGPGVVPSTLAP